MMFINFLNPKLHKNHKTYKTWCTNRFVRNTQTTQPKPTIKPWLIHRGRRCNAGTPTNQKRHETPKTWVNYITFLAFLSCYINRYLDLPRSPSNSHYQDYYILNRVGGLPGRGVDPINKHFAPKISSNLRFQASSPSFVQQWTLAAPRALGLRATREAKTTISSWFATLRCLEKSSKDILPKGDKTVSRGTLPEGWKGSTLPPRLMLAKKKNYYYYYYYYPNVSTYHVFPGAASTMSWNPKQVDWKKQTLVVISKPVEVLDSGPKRPCILYQPETTSLRKSQE